MFVRRAFFGKAFKVLAGLFVGHKVVQPAAAVEPDPKDGEIKWIRVEATARENVILREGLARLEAAMDNREYKDPRFDMRQSMGIISIPRRLDTLERRIWNIKESNVRISGELARAWDSGFRV